MTMMPPSFQLPTDLTRRPSGLGTLSFSVVALARGRCLHLHPISRSQLHSALGLPADDRCALLYPSGQIAVTSWAQAHTAPPEVEVVHLAPEHAVDLAALPVPLLLDLDQALPPGSRAAISAPDGAHAVLVSADGGLLRAALRAALERLPPPGASLPPLPDDFLDPLLEADDWEHHHDVTLRAHRRFWTLRVIRRGPAGEQTAQLVCENSDRGRWREGWTW